MPAKSKKQQQFMGMLYRCKETGECPSKDIKEKAKNIKKKDVLDFAKTKHKGLPTKVKPKKKKKRKKSKSELLDSDLLILASKLNDMGLEHYSCYIKQVINKYKE